MTGSILPEQIEELMAGYVLGDLSSEETEQLMGLLAENPQLATEIHRLQDTLEVLPYGLPEVEPPPHLRSAILEATSTPVSRLPLSRQSSLSWSKIALGATVLLALALGLDNFRLRQALQATDSQTQPLDTLTFSLQGIKTANAASASVVVNPNNLEGKLTVQNLPTLPPGKVYALWTVIKPDAPFTTDNKGAILTEVFNVDAQGKVLQPIAVSQVYRFPELISKVAVTIEDATSPQKHQGVPIMITKLVNQT